MKISDTASSVAIIYTHFPHYRSPVFEELEKSVNHRYDFYYDDRGVVDPTIKSGETSLCHFNMRTRKLGPLLFQYKALKIAAFGNYQSFIFLGNPWVISTWLAALIARVRGRRVLFWTHGWLRIERGLLGRIRVLFYHLADGLLLYGSRAKEIGRTIGFPTDRMFVIYNSLDYRKQAALRTAKRIANLHSSSVKPYILIVGRLINELETSIALDAIEVLNRGEDRLSLVVIGDGPCKTELEAIAKRKELPVKFLGPIYSEEELASWFLNASAVVSPGKVGLLAVHSLAYGIPVITHHDMDAQMPEVEAITDGVTGRFFERGSAISLATAITEFVSQATLAEMRAAEAVKIIEQKYTPARQRQFIEQAIAAILKKNQIS
jgi:glycosyltransferase involved in cell wall biosynthesis